MCVIQDLSILQQERDNREAVLSNCFFYPMLFGKRVATAQYCSSATPPGGSSIRFKPALASRAFKVFFDAGFKVQHRHSFQLFERAARAVGLACKVQEVDTERNAFELGPSKAMVVKSRVDFSNLIRALACVERERGERGTFRRSDGVSASLPGG